MGGAEHAVGCAGAGVGADADGGDAVIAAAKPILGALPWRYVLPGIGAALALWAAYDWAKGVGYHSRDKEVATLIQERDTARANVATLQGALDGQNKAIALAGQVTKQAQDIAAEAARGGRERDKAVAGLMGRLDAVRASEGRCVTPGAVHEAWGSIG